MNAPPGFLQDIAAPVLKMCACRAERGDLFAFAPRVGSAQIKVFASVRTGSCTGHRPVRLHIQVSSLFRAPKKHRGRRPRCFLVRERRLELPRRLTHAPQTCLSTCSSTLAYFPASFKARGIIADSRRLSRLNFPVPGFFRFRLPYRTAVGRFQAGSPRSAHVSRDPCTAGSAF